MLNEKYYICMQEFFIDNTVVYLCEEVETNKQILLYEKNGQIEKIRDNKIKEQIENLIYAKSPDIEFKKGSIKNGKIF